MGRGRRVQITVVFALIGLAIAGAGMHVEPPGSFGLAVLVGAAAWLVTGAVNERRD